MKVCHQVLPNYNSNYLHNKSLYLELQFTMDINRMLSMVGQGRDFVVTATDEFFNSNFTDLNKKQSPALDLPSPTSNSSILRPLSYISFMK